MASSSVSVRAKRLGIPGVDHRRVSDEEIMIAFRASSSRSAAARALGISVPALRARILRIGAEKFAPATLPVDVPREKLPAAGQVRRFILTCAQNNTPVHAPTWRNILALAEHYSAEVWVATINYNVGAYGSMAVKRGKAKKDRVLDYADEVKPYLKDEFVELAPGLIWCGALNLSITHSRPLSPWASYTGRKSGVFPHPKLELESVATAADRPVKLNYTTGAVTIRRYIEKGAGQQSSAWHSLGGLLVEVDSDGRWFCRQLCADRDTGCLQDLDLMVDGGVVTAGIAVASITWGDIHAAQIDVDVARLGWSTYDQMDSEAPSMLDALHPAEQHVHDLLDFYARNHHEIDTPSEMMRRHFEGRESVEEEIKQAVMILNDMHRPWCETVVVNSNHDRALQRWVDSRDGRRDPVNAMFWLAATEELYDAIRSRFDLCLLEWAARRTKRCPARVTFLRPGESRRVADAIEVGLHGDVGAGGARGSLAGFARMGDLLNLGHSHAAAIRDGVFVAGTCSKIPLSYTRGQPNSWSHSHIVTYAGGARAVITMFEGKWRA